MKFHIELILKNTTTIETLQLKAGKQTTDPANVIKTIISVRHWEVLQLGAGVRKESLALAAAEILRERGPSWRWSDLAKEGGFE